MENTSPEHTPEAEASPESQQGSPSEAAPAGGAPEVWGGVPSRNRLFAGREELLKELRAGLTGSGRAAVVPHAMHGLAGVGKTQIAVEYVYRYQKFYQVVWWINSDEPQLIESSIAALAPRLKLPYIGTGIEEDAAAVLDALRLGRPYSDWLLVFDGAIGPKSIGDFVLNGTGHTLITSLNPNWEETAQTVHVKVFDPAESTQYLARRVPGIGQKDSDDLAEALGHLPLALAQAGALQVEAAMPVSEYLALLNGPRASEVLAMAEVRGYPGSAALSWNASIRQLKEAMPEAVELLTCCAFFGPQPIPRDVLQGGRDTVTDSLSFILRDPLVFSKAVRSLQQYSLVDVVMPDLSIQVHRLVQALTRGEREGFSSQDQERYRHDVHRMLATATPRDPDNPATWPRFARLLPHYGPADMIACDDPDVRLSILDMIRYQYMAGAFHAALDLADKALERWSHDDNRAPDADRLAVKRHRGTVLRSLGMFHEAFDVNAATVAEATKELGATHAETLLVTNSHGADLRAAGDFRAAYELDTDSVSRHVAAFGDRDRRTLRAKNNFALDQALLGEFRQARALHEQVYQLGQEVYGTDGHSSDDHPSVLATVNSLVRDVRYCGEYADAYLLAQDNYAACRKNLGFSHPVTLRAARDLVIAERLAEGGTEDAVTRAADVYAQHTKRYGETHPATLAAAIALVNIWREAGNLDDATSLAELVIDVAPKAYGADHPFWYAIRGNLALVLRLSGETSRARELHQTSVDRLNVFLGPDHPYTLTCAMGLASDLAASNDLDEAQALGQETLDRIRKALWPDHPMALACATNVALDLQAMGREAEASQLRSSTLERYVSTLRNQHPATQAALKGKRIDFDFDPPPA